MVILLLLLNIALPPAPTHYVTDAAGVIEDTREQALNERLAQYDRDTSNQVLVYIDRRIPHGTTLEEMSAEAIRTWRVGQEQVDNGAILFLFIDDRASRIEVGYGLEEKLTDARSKRILVSMRPALRAGDYATAAEDGAYAILKAIDAPAQPAPTPAVTEYDEPVPSGGPPGGTGFLFGFLFLAGIAVVISLLRTHSVKWQGFPDSSGSWPDPPRHDPEPQSSYDSSTSWPSSSDSSSSWSSSSSDSSSSDSSSSTFSGGGGSGGGGGASDRW